MVEIIVAGIAGVFLILNTITTQKTQKALKVANGTPPGFMIEATYEKVHAIDKQLTVHIHDQIAHCKETHKEK